MNEKQHEYDESPGKENVKFFASIVGALCLVIIVPMNAWGIASFIDFAKATESRLAVLEYKNSQGTRYTAEMAAQNLKPIVEKINDHELRIRFNESEHVSRQDVLHLIENKF